MTTIIPTTEEDPSLAVVRFVSELTWADAGAEVAEHEVGRLCREAEECLVMAKWYELASLIITSADVIFPKAAEKDLECIYTVICNLVTKSERPEEVFEMAKLISGKVAQQPSDKPSLRLKILFNLYNLLEDGHSQYLVYMKALQLAASGKVTEHVIPSFKKVDDFLKEWNVGVQEQRELFLTISNVLKESKSNEKDSFSFLTKYLATFASEDADALREAKDVAVQAIVEFVKAPDMIQCDLLDMPAVVQLENDANHSLIYKLLQIFLTKRLDAYLEFQAANSDQLNSYGFVHEESIEKMKLISLMDLASHEHQIPYAVIKETLMINDDEVESWVFKAVTAKLLRCKMDQINQLVIISHYSERVFGQQQWDTLRSKLATWRGNISNVISTIQANKLNEDTTQAAQNMMVR
ncbi:hypothetical protein V2J09_012718 [Rumex salicifolius]